MRIGQTVSVFILAWVAMVLALPCRAQVTPTPGQTPVVKLSIGPASAPDPALKYRLLPAWPERTPGNAAPLYATAALLVSDEATSKYLDKVSEWISTSLADLRANPEATNVPPQLKSALHYVELAARRERCEWEIPWRSEGLSALLPDLAKYRSLARALAVKARLEIAQGKYDEAVRTLQAGYAMAQQVGQTPLLINGLVGIALASLMDLQVEALVQAPGSPNLYWALTALPSPLVDMRPAIETEMLGVLWAPRLRELDLSKASAAECQAALEQMFSATGSGGGNHAATALGLALLTYPRAKQYLVEHGRTPQEVEAMPVARVVLSCVLDSSDRLSQDMLRWSYLPYWEARRHLDDSERFLDETRLHLEALPAATLLPALGRVSYVSANLDRRVAALRCVEAIRLYMAGHKGALPAALSDIAEAPIPIDPVTGKPFDYEVQGNTAILSSHIPPDMTPDQGLRFELTAAQ